MPSAIKHSAGLPANHPTLAEAFQYLHPGSGRKAKDVRMESFTNFRWKSDTGKTEGRSAISSRSKILDIRDPHNLSDWRGTRSSPRDEDARLAHMGGWNPTDDVSLDFVFSYTYQRENNRTKTRSCAGKHLGKWRLSYSNRGAY